MAQTVARRPSEPNLLRRRLASLRRRLYFVVPFLQDTFDWI